MGHLEPLAAAVRVPGEYGEAFTWAASVRYFSPSVVEVLAAMRMPTPAEMRDLRRTLIRSGVTKAIVRLRNEDGTFEEIELVARNVRGELV